MSKIIICCDASTRKVDDSTNFYCAGAICINTQSTLYDIGIGTNNVGELRAMYLAAKLAVETRPLSPKSKIIIFSDSQFVVFGLTRWMDQWYKCQDNNGILYGTNGEPVKNQELFKMIISYIVSNKLQVSIRHCKGHININNPNHIRKAKQVFYNSNGYMIDDKTLDSVLFYNNIIDTATRERLKDITVEDYMVEHPNIQLVNHVIPNNYTKYIS